MLRYDEIDAVQLAEENAQLIAMIQKLTGFIDNREHANDAERDEAIALIAEADQLL